MIRARMRTGARLAVLLLAAAAPAADAQPLGRLFTSVDERANLDELRYQAQFATPEPEPEPEPVATGPGEPVQTAPEVSSFTVNGIVRSSSGRGTVWVNGDEIERGGLTREGIEVHTAGPGGRSVRARLPSGVDTIDIKPGQQIDVTHGVVLEPYERTERTPEGPSAFELGAGAARPAAGDERPASSDAAADAPAPVPGAATGAQRDAAVAAIVRQALAAMPPADAMTPEQRAQADALRRQLERVAAGASTAKP